MYARAQRNRCALQLLLPNIALVCNVAQAVRALAVHFHLQRCCAHRRVVQRDWMAYISENSVISCSLHLHICYFAPYARH